MSESSQAPEPNPAGPRSVSRFEAKLLRLLRYFLKGLPFDQVQPLFQTAMPAPRCLSPNAIHLIRDSLAKGCVLYLVRTGGWRREAFLRGQQAREGRVWERTGVEQRTLHFSAGVLELLIWLTANRVTERAGTLIALPDQYTPSDQLLVFLIYEGLQRDTELANATRGWAIFTSNLLCRLAYPDQFVLPAPPEVPDCERWFQSEGAVILESMQAFLRDRWVRLERGKGEIADWTQMRERGRAEQLLLETFLQAAERSHRQDLARFLIEALGRLLSNEIQSSFWIGGLHGQGPPRLSDRIETHRMAFSVVRQAERFRRWEQRARSSGYMDEDYGESRFFLREWERLNGGVLAQRAERLVREIEPL